MRVEQGDQGVDARVGGVIDLDQRRRLLDVGVELGQQRLARAVVDRIGRQQMPFRPALREAADAGAVVAEHRAAGAVAVDQRGQQLARVVRPSRFGQPRGEHGVAVEGLG